MWLIECEILQLRWFSENFIPKFSILSHTWGAEEEELTFKDLRKGRGKDKKGYLKLQKCAEKSLERDIQYCWVDTCCIDKASSAELSEAINSMFNWYKLAAVCFAYLADIHEDIEVIELLGKNRLPRTIEKSRWFTRGWTLQELIAPKDVIFYDSKWEQIGTKLQDNTGVLVECTGIDPEVLSGIRPLHDVPVGERLSWASKRRTTRTEDAAYCLLGIFDVNMPLLYGEGPKAFLRLQEEIMKRSTDLSLLAWERVASATIPDHVPAESTAELDSLGEGLSTSTSRYLAESPAEFSHLFKRTLLVEWRPQDDQFSAKSRGIAVHLGLLCITPGYLLGVLGYTCDSCYLAVLLRSSAGTLADPEPMKRVANQPLWKIPRQSLDLDQLRTLTVVLVDKSGQDSRSREFGVFEFKREPSGTEDDDHGGAMELIKWSRPNSEIWDRSDNLEYDPAEMTKVWRDPIFVRIREDGNYFDIGLEVALNSHGRLDPEKCRCVAAETQSDRNFPIFGQDYYFRGGHFLPLSSGPSWMYRAKQGRLKIRLERRQHIGNDSIVAWIGFYPTTKYIDETIIHTFRSACNRSRCECDQCRGLDMPSKSTAGLRRLGALPLPGQPSAAIERLNAGGTKVEEVKPNKVPIMESVGQPESIDEKKSNRKSGIRNWFRSISGKLATETMEWPTVASNEAASDKLPIIHIVNEEIQELPGDIPASVEISASIPSGRLSFVAAESEKLDVHDTNDGIESLDG